MKVRIRRHTGCGNFEEAEVEESEIQADDEVLPEQDEEALEVSEEFRRIERVAIRQE